MLPIYENFRDFEAPVWLKPTVERLLSSLAPEHTAGLQSIVLTNAATVKGKTGRVGRRKYHRNKCGGFYHRATRNDQAWIEVLVDNTLGRMPRFLLRIQFFRDAAVGRTLYHEIGHHLDATLGAATRAGEAAAEDWRKRLSKLHGRKRYSYLRPLRTPLRLLVRILRAVSRLARRVSGAA